MMNLSFYESLILVPIPHQTYSLLICSGKSSTRVGRSWRRKGISSRSKTFTRQRNQRKQRPQSGIPPFYPPILIIVKRHCRISSGAIPRSSPTDGNTRLPSLTDAQIEIYSPDSLIVGTRGRDGAIGGLLPGSMSKSPPHPPTRLEKGVLIIDTVYNIPPSQSSWFTPPKDVSTANINVKKTLIDNRTYTSSN